MGLDAVELVMDVEEEFKIKIPNAAASRIETVGQLHSFVLSRLCTTDTERCPTRAFFYQLRTALTDLYAVPRKNVAVSKRMEELIPREDRIYQWWKLSKRLGLRLPRLERPQWVFNRAVFAFLAILAISATAAFLLHPVIMGFIFPCIFFPLFYEPLTRRYATLIPGDCGTVRDFVQTITPLGYSRFISNDNAKKKDIWDRVVHVVAKQTGTNVATIDENTRFVDDLGMS